MRHSALVLGWLITGAGIAAAGTQTLQYPDPVLHYVYPAGGRQGETVRVEMGLAGFRDAKAVLVDGPPGVTVGDVEPAKEALGAVFHIAPDAPPGRRWVRVVGGAAGLTNYRTFFVGRMPEVVEREPNETPASAAEVSPPVVVNGRIGRDVDVDCFRFHARAGQRIVAAVLAHGMDSPGHTGLGILDTSLELQDGKGTLLATAEDTLGLDPVLTYTARADGPHVVRVQSLGYRGAPRAVYRLTLGDLPYPTHVFPAGGRRGEKVDLEFGGPDGSRRVFSVPAEGTSPLAYVAPELPLADGRDFPFIRGDLPEHIESEPNDLPAQAAEVPLPAVVNGRFGRAADVDSFRVRLRRGQGLLLEVLAQRHLRSPVDTVLEVWDEAGKKLAENDDGKLFAHPNACAHDFASADSWLAWTAPADGAYRVRLRNENGKGGPEAVYRLTLAELGADFQVFQWPDAVPVWGPGATASLIVEFFHWGGLEGDVRLSVEGLPAGWRGSAATVSSSLYRNVAPPSGLKVFLTITAPPDAPAETVARFRVLAKVEHQGRVLEREAQAMTLYGAGPNDRMWLRYSPGARAVVAAPLDCRLETSVKEIKATPGETVEIPVRIHRKPGKGGEMGLVVNGPTTGIQCGLGPPVPLPSGVEEFRMPVKLPENMKPGPHDIVVARSWASDIRAGRPGPCTPLIRLEVLPPRK